MFLQMVKRMLRHISHSQIPEKLPACLTTKQVFQNTKGTKEICDLAMRQKKVHVQCTPIASLANWKFENRGTLVPKWLWLTPYKSCWAGGWRQALPESGASSPTTSLLLFSSGKTSEDWLRLIPNVSGAAKRLDFGLWWKPVWSKPCCSKLS